LLIHGYRNPILLPKSKAFGKRRITMSRKSFNFMIIALCVGLAMLLASGCVKKSVKQDPSMMSAEELAAEKERAAKLEAEQKERELARLKEEAKKREQEQKEFEKSLAAKKTPGIEGEVYESKLFKRIHFDFDRYEIRGSEAQILKENAAVLMKFPAVKIQIEGHCDARGTNEYNLALGERRANSAKQYLLSLGIAAGRISIISYGEERPLEIAPSEDAWAKNRRADFLVLSK
jgi:peptidoglycan-associated lipoprotein